MQKWLLILFGLLAFEEAMSQDSATAKYINTLVERIESNLAYDASVIKDTIIYDDPDSMSKSQALVLRTEYFFKGRSNQIEKIFEKSKYGLWSTSMVVYYLNGEPIRFSSIESHGDTVKVDFDIYYMHNICVHFVKRNPAKGKPDDAVFLKWSYELLKGYRE